MVKSGFNATPNGIGTYFSIINQISVVFSMVFENITQYVPIDHSVVKHYFSGTLNGI